MIVNTDGKEQFSTYVLNRIANEWQSETALYIQEKNLLKKTFHDSISWSCLPPKETDYSTFYDIFLKEIVRFMRDISARACQNFICFGVQYEYPSKHGDIRFKCTIYNYPFENYVLERLMNEMKSCASLSFTTGKMDERNKIFSTMSAVKELSKDMTPKCRSEYVDDFVRLIRESQLKVEGMHIVMSMIIRFGNSISLSLYKRDEATISFEDYVSKRINEERVMTNIRKIEEDDKEAHSTKLLEMDHGEFGSIVRHIDSQERHTYVDTLIERLKKLAKENYSTQCYSVQIDISENNLRYTIFRPEEETAIEPIDKLKAAIVSTLNLKEADDSIRATQCRDGFFLLMPIDMLSSHDDVLERIRSGIEKKHIPENYTHFFVDKVIKGTFIHIEVLHLWSKGIPESHIFTSRLVDHERDFRIGVRHALGNNSLLEHKKRLATSYPDECVTALYSVRLSKEEFDECYIKSVKTMASYIQRNRKSPLISQYYDLDVRIDTNESLQTKIIVYCSLYGSHEKKILIPKHISYVDSFDSIKESLRECGLTINEHSTKPEVIVNELVLSYIIDHNEPRVSYRNLMINVQMSLKSNPEFTHAHVDTTFNESIEFINVNLYCCYDGDEQDYMMSKDREKGRICRDELVHLMTRVRGKNLRRLLHNPGDFKFHSVWRAKDRILEKNVNEEARMMMEEMTQQMNEILLANPKLGAFYVHVNMMPYKSGHVAIEMHGLLCPLEIKREKK